MIEVVRPEATYYLPKGLPQHKIDRFIEYGTEPDLLPLLETILTRNTGDVITAGVFVGGLLPTLCKFATRVWAWDCVPEHVECAHKMTKTNGLRNCTVQLAALGDQRETVTVTTGCTGQPTLAGESCIVENGECVSDLLDLKGYDLDTFEVQQVTIDSNEYRDLALIQLDLEGYELPALVGAKRTIEQHTPAIIVEDRPALCHSLLVSWGYSFQGTCSGDRIYVHRSKLDK